MEKMTKQDGKSLDMVKENLEALKAIFPEAFTEDGVNFETLRQLLGDEVAEGEEKYGLNWHGKKKARQIALTPSLGTLRPCKEESVDWDTTQNLFIEGDNLEVLKLLQKSYANKVKMIYIDPPYNTGKEFIYPDKFQDNLDTYLKYTGQKDEEGFKISSNTDSSGRYHTNWLNMMYPRLKLARNLIRDEGAIFISIDDYEVNSLRNLCDEIYGEENFIETLVWKRRATAPNDRVIGRNHEYVLSYAKNIDRLNISLQPKSERVLARYKNPDSDPKGSWVASDLSANGKGGRLVESCVFAIVNPNNNKEYYPPTNKCWLYNKEKVDQLRSEGRIGFREKSGTPYLKRYASEVRQGSTLPTIINDGGFSQDSAKEIKHLFGTDVSEFPKPVKLMKKLLTCGLQEEDVILDFFAGSSTTAQATYELNKENNSNSSFIMVQLPEPCDEKSEAFKAGFKTIADIGKERIRRAAAKIKEETPLYQGDLGFKVFKLDSSNIQTWNPDRNDLEQTLLDHANHLVEGRSEEDVLYELLLKRGVDLTVPIEQKEISDKSVYSIGYGVLFACLDTSISRDEVESLAQGIVAWHEELKPESDTQVVFRDSAFADDIAKTNMTAILEQNGIAHVRSL